MLTNEADILANSLDQNTLSENEKIIYLSPKGKSLIKYMQRNFKRKI